MSIAENLRAIEARIEAACAACGRLPSDVRLLPVSKTHPVDSLLEARAAGYLRFGENRVQEAAAKAEELAGTDIELAIIGHLQTNKAKQLVEFAAEFQALDSLKLARELDKRCQAAGRQLDVLVQVNSSAEPQKSGIEPGDALAFARELKAFDALNIKGLMTLALFSDDRDAVAACFQRTADVREQLRQADGGGWGELSMGMSGDFELAIAHGSTCVRVGQAIFGARLNPLDYWPAGG